MSQAQSQMRRLMFPEPRLGSPGFVSNEYLVYVSPLTSDKLDLLTSASRGTQKCNPDDSPVTLNALPCLVLVYTN